MAITNASDLLVYAKTASAEAQVTRIYVKEVDPLEIPDGSTTGTLKLNNITDNSGYVYDDEETNASANDGASVLAVISTMLVTDNGYSQTAASVLDGDYRYRDYTNGVNGIVPILEIINGTATINEDAIIIEILTPGSSAIFDPVAFSTSASFSVNRDLRDITNKDSGGWSEVEPGLKSFEISTELLQSINPDVPLNGTDFFDKLKNGTEVDLTFSDRIRNIIRTNLTQGGVDGFFIDSNTTQVNLQADPFGGTTASSIQSTTASQNRLQYSISPTRLQGKKLTWSFYLRGDNATSTTKATINIPFASLNDATIRIVGGNGSESVSAYTHANIGSGYYKIEGLDETWCRVVVEWPGKYDAKGEDQISSVQFRIYPGLAEEQSSDKVFVSSWQLEQSNSVSDYQDPINITHWQGYALVSSLSFDAGVEDNCVCSATFTGTGNIYPNGLGPELITDTGFDNPSYWSVSGGSSVVENGYGKIITTGATTQLATPNIMNVGDYYLLTYTISSSPSPQGSIQIDKGWQNSPDIHMKIPSTAGTHSVLLYPEMQSLEFVRVAGGQVTIWLSSISLKKVL
jgi:hypothetical protein